MLDLFKKKKDRKVVENYVNAVIDSPMKFKGPLGEVQSWGQAELGKGRKEDEVVKEATDRYYEVLRQYIAASKEVAPPSDEEVTEMAKKLFGLQLEALKDTTPASIDKIEFGTQDIFTKLIAVPEKTKLFLTAYENACETTQGCPWVVKRYIKTLANMMQPRYPTGAEVKLAEEIVQLVKPDLKSKDEEIYNSFIGSLSWRGKETLEKMKKAVTETPPERRKIKGRESCIFIETDEDVHYVG